MNHSYVDEVRVRTWPTEGAFPDTMVELSRGDYCGRYVVKFGVNLRDAIEGLKGQFLDECVHGVPSTRLAERTEP
jgi:hypothetical protein